MTRLCCPRSQFLRDSSAGGITTDPSDEPVAMAVLDGPGSTRRGSLPNSNSRAEF